MPTSHFAKYTVEESLTARSRPERQFGSGEEKNEMAVSLN